jgi:hypothetical protein
MEDERFERIPPDRLEDFSPHLRASACQPIPAFVTDAFL